MKHADTAIATLPGLPTDDVTADAEARKAHAADAAKAWRWIRIRLRSEMSDDEVRALVLSVLQEKQPQLQAEAGVVERFVNRDGHEVGGGGSIVNATGWDAREGYGVATAPSMRMVVSVADWDDSRWINLTGVSGHPASSHYSDQTELYVDGETLPWAYSREAVEEAAEDRLVLTPAG